MSEIPQLKTVYRCACCGSHFPFILACFDCDLNAPVCSTCLKLLWDAREVLKQNGIVNCVNEPRR